MARSLFSIPIFFIVFRETLEASIIVSVLLGLVEQIVLGGDVQTSPNDTLARTSHDRSAPDHDKTPNNDEKLPESNAGSSPSGNGADTANTLGETTPADSGSGTTPVDLDNDSALANKRLVRKLRWQIFLGGITGFLIAVSIGAAFIAVWFTQASNLWQKSENLWEGIFSLIA